MHGIYIKIKDVCEFRYDIFSHTRCVNNNQINIKNLQCVCIIVTN